MSPAAAFASDTVLTYIVLAGALLSGSGALLLFLTYGLERQLGSVWRKYYGWLVMVPLILAVVLAGRAATIVSVAVLAICGFREFARATGLYRDWWMTGAVYLGIVAVGVTSLVHDPWLRVPGWYGRIAGSCRGLGRRE